MSNYTKTTNFTAKDSLPSGNANKKINGSLFDTEFDALATAVNSKSNTATPSFTGVVTSAGNVVVDDATDSTSGTTGSIQTDGGIGAVKDVVTDATFKPLGDTAAGDAAAMGYTATEGLILTGQGSTNDVTIKNDADATVMSVPTGTTAANFAGNIAGQQITAQSGAYTGGLILGANVASTAVTTATAKVGRIVMPTYDSDTEEDMFVIGASSDGSINDIYYGGGAGVLNAATTHYWYAANNDTTTTGNLVLTLGTVLADFNVIVDASSNGAYFGTAAAANLLDDYEEGTWTPVLSDGTNNATQDVSVASYVKIGKSVQIQGRIRVTSLGSVSGAIRITGLPFTAVNTSNYYGTVHFGYAVNMNLTAGYHPSGYVITNTTYVDVQLWDSTGGTSAMQHTEWSASGSGIFSGQYEAT